MTWSAEAFRERFNAVCPHGKQKLIAEFCDIPSTQISDWKNPKSDKQPFIDQIETLAIALGVSPGWLAFGDDFVPMDDEEVHLIKHWRMLKEDERKQFLQTFEVLTRERTTIKTLAPRPKKELSIEVNHDVAPGLQVTAVTPGAPGDADQSAPLPMQYPTPLLEKLGVEALQPEEVEAFVSLTGRQGKQAPVEHPLTRALQKIAMMLIGGIVPVEERRDLGTIGETSAKPSASAPTSKTQRPHDQLPSLSPSVSSSPSSPPRSKPRKKT